MKKVLAISGMVLGVLSLMAIGFIKQSAEVSGKVSQEISPELKENEVIQEVAALNPMDDFALEVGPRFMATISKEDLDKAVSISDIIPEDANWDRYVILKTQVRRNNFDLEKAATGTDLKLNTAQLALLKRTQYSDDLQFGAQHDDSWESGSLNYMVSVVPEKQVEYIGGKDQLVSYLREGSSSIITFFNKGKWEAGKIKFTVDAQGLVSNVDLISTSGIIELDQRMIKLIFDTPDKWAPAENAKGEKVEQILTLSFGNIGC